MKNDLNFKESKKSFFGGKGLYLALAVCLCGAVGATWYSVKKATEEIEETPPPFVSGAEVDTSPDTSSEDSSLEEQPTEPSKQPISSEEQTDSEETESSNESYQASADVSPEFYIMPVAGEIINDYSDGLVVKNETLADWRTHDGIDISAAVTTPVKSVADGTVKEIYYDDLYGTVVVVSHSGGIESYYSNLNEIVNVEVGQSVTAGHVLGSVGASAICESAIEEHLHFAMKENGEWIDPINTIGAGE